MGVKIQLELIYSTQNLRVWLIEDHLAISKLPNPELHLWNPTASAIWILLLDGDKTLDEIALAIEGIFSNCPNNIGPDLKSCLNEWTEQGWIKKFDSLRYSICQNIKTTPDVDYAFEKPKFSKSILSKNYQINKSVFSLTVKSEPSYNFQPFLSRLVALVSGFTETFDTPKYAFEISIGDDGIYLSENLKCYRKFQTQADALSHCIQFFLKSSSDDLTHFVTLHAAGIGKERSLILSGVSGSGKSTLCALLSKKGWEYYGDDLVGLSVNKKIEASLIPLPTGISVKSDNWDMLAVEYPGIENLEVVKYGDKVAKFLSIPTSSNTSNNKKQVRGIVFPTYLKNSKTSYARLSAIEALSKLVDAGISLHQDMQAEEVENFLNFLITHPIYQLSYSDIEEANTWLSTLLRD